MSQEKLELVRGAFAQVTIPGDPEPMIAAAGPGFEMRLIGVTGEPVFYVGADGIRDWFRDVAQSWETFRFEATGMRDAGDRVLVLGDVCARGRVSAAEVHARWAWIIELRAGKAAGLRGFVDQRKALEAVGMSE